VAKWQVTVTIWQDAFWVQRSLWVQGRKDNFWSKINHFAFIIKKYTQTASNIEISLTSQSWVYLYDSNTGLSTQKFWLKVCHIWICGMLNLYPPSRRRFILRGTNISNWWIIFPSHDAPRLEPPSVNLGNARLPPPSQLAEMGYINLKWHLLLSQVSGQVRTTWFKNSSYILTAGHEYSSHNVSGSNVLPHLIIPSTAIFKFGNNRAWPGYAIPATFDKLRQFKE
jgi:hypothetical protein